MKFNSILFRNQMSNHAETQLYFYASADIYLDDHKQHIQFVTLGNPQRLDRLERLDVERQHHIWLEKEKWAMVDGDKG